MPVMMPSTGALRAFAERYTAAWCSQNPDAVAAFFAPNGSLRVNDSPPAIGRDAIAATAQSFMTTFPDLTVLFDDLRIDGERIEYHWTLTGTHANGRKVRISGYEDWRFDADHLIAVSQGYFDAAEYQRQLEA